MRNPRYLFDRKPGGPQSRSGRFGVDTILLILPGPEPQTVQPVAQSLKWLPYSSSCHRGNSTHQHAYKLFNPFQRKVRVYFKYSKFYLCLSVHRCTCVEKKNQLDVTVCFIAHMIRSTCCGHFYAHHQEL